MQTLSTAVQRLLDVAALELGTHAPENLARINEYRMVTGNPYSGEPWCMCFVQWCLHKIEDELGEPSNVAESAGTKAVWNLTDARYKSQIPKAGSIVIWQLDGTGHGHCGIIEAVDAGSKTLHTIEGNTSNVDIRTGGWVERKKRPFAGMGQYKLLGFIEPFYASEDFQSLPVILPPAV